MDSFDLIVDGLNIFFWIIMGIIVLLIVIKNKNGKTIFPEDASEQFDKRMQPIINTALIVFILVVIIDYFS